MTFFYPGLGSKDTVFQIIQIRITKSVFSENKSLLSTCQILFVTPLTPTFGVILPREIKKHLFNYFLLYFKTFIYF